MKAECQKDKLKEAVFQVGKISGKNLSLPILECILLETKDKFIVLKATNLDIGLEVAVPAKVEKQGRVAVPGYLLSGFLQMLDRDEPIKIETINDNLSVSTSKNSTLIKSFPADEFPLIPRIEKEESLSLNASILVEGIKSVAHSALISDIKPEISSVYMYYDNNHIYFVSTDSSRLAEKRYEVKNGPKFSSAILPIKNANEIVRIFEGIQGEVELIFTKNQMSILVASLYFTSRVVGGIYPDYKQIVPKEKKTEVVVLKEDLADSIKISTIFSDKFNQVNFKISPAEELFEISSRNQDKGESVTKTDAVLEGEDVDISFNSKFVLDCLNSIKGDSVAMSFNGHQKPTIIRGVGDDSFMYLIMPMIR